VRRRQAVARRVNLSSKCLYLDNRTLLLQRIDLGLKCGKYIFNTLLQVNLAESRSRPSRPHDSAYDASLGSGKGNKEIAVELRITVRTVESHRAKIMLRLGLHSLTELVHFPIRNKIISPLNP